MVITGNFENLHSKLKKFQNEKVQLEEKMQTTPRVSKGAVNFGFYQLNRQKEQIQSQILKLNSILKPDIIA